MAPPKAVWRWPVAPRHGLFHTASFELRDQITDDRLPAKSIQLALVSDQAALRNEIQPLVQRKCRSSKGQHAAKQGTDNRDQTQCQWFLWNGFTPKVSYGRRAVHGGACRGHFFTTQMAQPRNHSLTALSQLATRPWRSFGGYPSLRCFTLSQDAQDALFCH